MMPAFFAAGASTPRRAFEAGADGQLTFRFPDDFLTDSNGQPVPTPVRQWALRGFAVYGDLGGGEVLARWEQATVDLFWLGHCRWR